MPREFDFGFKTEPCLRLQRIEEILRQQRIFDPAPSRPTLIKLIEDGTLEGLLTSVGYVVYEYSFKAWVRSFQPQANIQQATKPKLRIAVGA
jgi:hypothetical protein